MATPRHLNNAPITEALVDIKVVPKQGLTFADLEAMCNAMSFGFYVKGKISHGTVGLMLPNDGQEPQANAAMTQVGIRLHSNDEKYVAQFRLDGLTLSRLPPYESWDFFIEEAKRVWNIYRAELLPMRITRLATRFINNLRLPMEHGMSFQLYVNKLIDLPESLPQGVVSFFQNFQLIDIPNQATTNLTLALESAGLSGPLPVILDLDVFTNRDIDPINSNDLWKTLDNLRDVKNQCFFGLLTENAMELYK